MAFTPIGAGWRVFSNAAANGQIFGQTTGTQATSAAFGVDDTDTGKFKIQVVSGALAAPTGTVQFTIDPSTNGNITLNPNGTGAVVVTTDIDMSNTTSQYIGVINWGAFPYIHNYPGGNNNFFMGLDAGNFTMTTSGGCTGVGYEALTSITTASYQTAVGGGALRSNTNGQTNDAFGYGALGGLLANGFGNVSIGANSLASVKYGSNNTCVGNGAGGAYTNSESDNIIVGNSTGVGGEYFTIRIGEQGTQNSCYIAGIYGSSVGATNSAVFIDSTGNLGTSGGSGGTVTSITGTANQITASAATGSVTLSTPSTFIAPGSIASTTTITGATGITATTGGVTATAGGLTATAGGLTVTAGAYVEPYTAIAFANSPYSALTTDYYISVNTSGGAITVKLPNAPTTGRVFVIKDNSGNANANNLSITTVGGSVTIDGATTYTISQNYGSITVVFNATSYEVR
jgi:trimeric autotransporter adhesin